MRDESLSLNVVHEVHAVDGVRYGFLFECADEAFKVNAACAVLIECAENSDDLLLGDVFFILHESKFHFHR